MDVAAEPANFRIHDRDDKARINKLPSIKKPKLVFKTGKRPARTKNIGFIWWRFV